MISRGEAPAGFASRAEIERRDDLPADATGRNPFRPAHQAGQAHAAFPCGAFAATQTSIAGAEIAA